MEPAVSGVPDVMQVCRNGHVITDLLQTHPDRGLAHCDRCGAPTLDRCPTCGQRILGATVVPGLVPLGTRSAPECCFACGAPFPWAHRPAPAAAQDALAVLEAFLRRVPRTIRQLRSRHADRPAFRVRDEHDLEDLLRALLPLQFDEVRREGRTPAYARCTRSDFRLGKEAGSVCLALTVKLVDRPGGEVELREQWPEDVAYYERLRDCRGLTAFVYDPEGTVRDVAQAEACWTARETGLKLGCVIAS
jgi:hypothetical protein